MKKFILLIILVTSAAARDLGTYGETFAIFENDLLEEIRLKLENLETTGTILRHQQHIQKQISAKIERPVKVAGLVKTKVARVFLYDPAIRVPQDLACDKGQVFIKAGTIVNPLEVINFDKILIFIDGDDLSQVNWSMTQNAERVKIILVNGAPLKLSNQYKRRFYFDQHGLLIKKFGIKQIPARVSQKNHSLQIEEIVL